MQKYSVSFTEEAESDIAELMAFYEELVDAESAIKFFDEAMETVASLQNTPRANVAFGVKLPLFRTPSSDVFCVYRGPWRRLEVTS